MEPTTHPIAPPDPICATCDGPLEPGRRWRCVACQPAAEIAVAEASGPDGTHAVIRPSDVDRTRTSSHPIGTQNRRIGYHPGSSEGTRRMADSKGPKAPRDCINSLSLDFSPREGE